ncbi:hypothetical protein [Rhizobium sp. BT03]|uniref:hypothetical protein n=1 Tax=Rhizobium sp. BT03 TaxID=3045156 RepID=UPI0034E95605
MEETNVVEEYVEYLVNKVVHCRMVCLGFRNERIEVVLVDQVHGGKRHFVGLEEADQEAGLVLVPTVHLLLDNVANDRIKEMVEIGKLVKRPHQVEHLHIPENLFDATKICAVVLDYIEYRVGEVVDAKAPGLVIMPRLVSHKASPAAI